ncbi:MAG: hypothetical protein ACYS1A_13730 [Planctomycetota bacterium]
MKDKSIIPRRVYCTPCDSHFDISIPKGTVVVEGKVVDCTDHIHFRILCPKCGNGHNFNSIELPF